MGSQEHNYFYVFSRNFQVRTSHWGAVEVEAENAKLSSIQCHAIVRTLSVQTVICQVEGSDDVLCSVACAGYFLHQRL